MAVTSLLDTDATEKDQQITTSLQTTLAGKQDERLVDQLSDVELVLHHGDFDRQASLSFCPKSESLTVKISMAHY